MGLRAKVIFGLVLFAVIFSLRFLCANCQQVEEAAAAAPTSAASDSGGLDLDQTDAGGGGGLGEAAGLPATSPSRSRLHQPQKWRAVTTSATFVDLERSDKDVLSPNPYETWPSDETPLRRRRPGVRKRKRRPQTFTTEQTDVNPVWREEVVQDVIHVQSSREPISSYQPQFEVPSSPMTKYADTARERVREPMAALEREQKLSEIRGRQKEVRPESTETTKSNKSYRKPYSQARREEETSKEAVPPRQPATDLKHILKNSGGLSLSEILQQKNLSLDDLLKGKQNALLALQTTAPPATEPTTRYTKPVRRIPWTYLSSTPQTIRIESTPEPQTSSSENSPSDSQEETIEPTISPTLFYVEAIANETSNDELQNTLEIATVATLRGRVSEARIQSLNRHVVYPSRPQFRLPSSTMTTSTTTTTTTTATPAPETTTVEINDPQPTEKVEKIESSSLQPEYRPSFIPQYRRRPPIRPRPKITPFLKYTSSSSSSSSESSSSSSSSSSEHGHGEPRDEKLREDSIEDKLKESQPDDNLVEKPIPIHSSSGKVVSTSLEELFGSPLRPVSITPRIDRISSIKPDVTERNPSLFLDLTSDHNVDDRTDILELMEDRRSGGRLFKILSQRNMSLEELIEHRRRGSSQLHLAEIIQNKSRIFPEAAGLSSSIDSNLDIVTAFENFPHFNLANLKSINPDEIKTDSQGESYFTSIIDIEPTDGIYKGDRPIMEANPLLSGLPPSHEIRPHVNQPHRSLNEKKINFLPPHWDSLSLASYTSQENSIDFKHGSPGHLTSNISPPKEMDVSDPGMRIEDEIARAHDLLDLELSGHGFKRSTVNIESAQMPTGIRSAILASSAIVAVSLLVFLVIFVVCRWRQRRRNKLSYADSYAAIKAKIPIISRQVAMKRISENSSPIIFPGSKSCKINTMDPNSPEVQDYLFDAIRKPY